MKDEYLFAEDIRVTPQMIEAGEFEAIERQGGSMSDVVRAIYIAMEVERLVEPAPGYAR